LKEIQALISKPFNLLDRKVSIQQHAVVVRSRLLCLCCGLVQGCKASSLGELRFGSRALYEPNGNAVAVQNLTILIGIDRWHVIAIMN
jgi:hypothetical protein